MSKFWKKRILRLLGIIAVFIIAIVIINPLPKFIRYKINKSVSDLNIKGIEIQEIQDLKIENTPIRIYNSDSLKKLVILYIPGGAFIAGNLETHDNIARYLASNLDAVVVSLDYRKAPENKYPKGLHDAEKIFKWIVENVDHYNINPAQILLMGDSGGANFCAVLSHTYKELIAGQILINPALDLTENGPAYKNWDMFVKWYLNDLSESKSKDVSPLLAESFKGLPTTIIVTCENDPLKIDGEKYSAKLESEGVLVILRNFEELGHLANLWAGTSNETEKIRKFVVQEVRKIVK